MIKKKSSVYYVFQIKVVTYNTLYLTDISKVCTYMYIFVYMCISDWKSYINSILYKY